MKKLLFILFGLILIFGQALLGNIINIPDDYPTIQQGIDVSVEGDTVLVQPGTYIENINYNGKNIVVGSLFLTTQDTSYISQTIIDGNYNGSVVTFVSGEDSTAVLTGFTITNGCFSGSGGGIYCSSSSPSISNNTISSNDDHGIYCSSYSSPTILNNILYDDYYGIYAHSSPSSLEYNLFWLNDYAGSGDGIPSAFGEIVTVNANGDSCDTYCNLFMDPLFVDPDNGDYHLSWTNFPIPDSTMSPCIDAGDPNSPLDPDGTIADMGAYYFDQSQQGVGNTPILPTRCLLYQNYPNPFSTSTTISFNLATKLHELAVIKIYNIKVQLVKQLSIDNKQSTIKWDGKDEKGNLLSSGFYFY